MRPRLLVAVVAMIFLTLPVLLGQVVSNANPPDQPPLAFFTYTPSIPTPGQTIVFNASTSYDPDGWIVSYTWNFGDGNAITVTSPTITHSYPIDGSYTVELTVTDDDSTTGTATAVVEVSTVTFFRVVKKGTLDPVSSVEVTAYYYNGSGWSKAPPGPHGFEIKYDFMTAPHLANSDPERYRNPGYTAQTLYKNASNIGFDLHPSCWTVYFKFKYGDVVTYWPNDTTRVYTYKSGAIETYDYGSGHRAYWDPSASAYVIRVGDIPGNGVSPTESHPIIVEIACPPPTQKYYLTVKTDPTGITAIPGEGWYLNATNVTLNATQYVDGSLGSRYKFSYWDVDGTSQGTGVNPIIISMGANHTATAHYIKQYSVVFSQTGLTPDATGTVVVVNGSSKSYTDLAYTLWVDSGSKVFYSFSSPVSSSVSGKRYRLSTVSGPSSPITMNSSTTVTGNYVTQYALKFAQTGLDSDSNGIVVIVNGTGKVLGDLPYTPWVDCGDIITYSYSSPVSSSVSGKQFGLTTVSGPDSPITITGSATVTGNYVIQYLVTFAQSGLDSTAAGTVVTVNGTARTYNYLSYGWWVDSGSVVVYSYNDPVLSTETGKQFKQTGISGPASPITVTSALTVAGNYKIQYQITFDQTGVGSDFTGTIVTVYGNNYNYYGLPVQFWRDKDSNLAFSFVSPLTVDAGKQYVWSGTSGLSNGQNGTLTITASGSVVGNYAMLNCVTFDQLGVGGDFAGTIVTVDGTPYSVLPQSFMWQLGSVHSFSFQSPLVVTANVKQHVWISTTGLSIVQSGSINVSAFGSIVGHYKTEYYLSLVTNPSGKADPSGSGWYEAGTYASISTDQYLYGGSRWRFAGWITLEMSEITDPTSPSTTVLMDEAKTVTADYVHQYLITFNQNGLDSNATGTVVTANGTTRTYGQLPYALWADEGCNLSYFFEPTVSCTEVGKRFRLDSVTGPSSPITVSVDSTVIGNYVPQYYLIVSSPYSTPGGQGWYDSGATAYANLTSGEFDYGNGTRRVFTSWSGDASGTSYAQSNAIVMNGAKTAVANWNKMQYYLKLTTDPSGVAFPSGEGWYDANSNASITTPAYVDIVLGSSLYRFNGWTTANMTEIDDPTRAPTAVLMDEAKTVTANYATQYCITFSQTGVGPDFPGAVVSIDGVNFTVSPVNPLPVSFWWDKNAFHMFAFYSPLVVTTNAKQYVWANTTGLSTLQSGSITVSASGSVTGNYKTQYFFAVTSPYDSPTPVTGWFDAGASITASVTSPFAGLTGIRHVCTGWTGTGSVPLIGSGPTASFVLTQPSSLIWSWKTQYYLMVIISPWSIVTIPGQNWYDPPTNVSLSAPAVSGYEFKYWDVDGIHQGEGVSSIAVSMNDPHTAEAYYKTISSEAETVGGYSISQPRQASYRVLAYIATITLFGAYLTRLRRRKK